MLAQRAMRSFAATLQRMAFLEVDSQAEGTPMPKVERVQEAAKQLEAFGSCSFR